MNSAIIGAGNVGGTLGVAGARRGHEVVFGVRDASDPKLEELRARTGGKARAGTVRDAVIPAEVVTLTVPWPAVPDALRTAGDLGGKILLDCTNPLEADLSGLTVGYTTSGAEHVAAWAGGAARREDLQHDGVRQHGGSRVSRGACDDAVLR